MNETVEPARLSIAQDGGIARVSFPRQKIDGVAVRELYELAMGLTNQPHPKLLVDLTGVPMITSGAVGIMLAIRKKFMQHGGQIHLAGADALVAQSLQVMNLHRLLRIFETPAAAAAAFK